MKIQTSAPDPLLSEFELPLRAVYHPLGFSVEIATNSKEVLAGAEESWGHFRKIFPEPAVHLRIGVVEGGPEMCPPAPVCRAQLNLLARVADARNYSVSDLKRGFAFSWLTQTVVENRAYTRYHFIEGMSWDLLESLYLTSIHGACVSMGERGVLLCGDSGAGKSSLSFACARTGWTFLSDDSCCLVRRRAGRIVVGNPHQMRFRESAVELFPELKDQRITLRADGEFAIELRPARLAEIRRTYECSIDYIVFLNRGEPGPPSLLPFPKNKALEWFEQVVCYGEKEVRDDRKASLRNLLTAEIFELRYSDLDAAVKRLETLVRDGQRPRSGLSVA
jgi:HPr serine kinase-like protein